MDTLPRSAQDGKTPLKRCKNCPDPEENKWHPATTEFFSPQKSGKYGLKSLCRPCQLEYNHAYYAAHRKEISEQRKGYYQEHQEHLKQYSAQYRNDHPEEVRQYSAQYNASDGRRQAKVRYNASHREEIRQYSVKYHAEHREEHRQYRARLHVKRHEDELRCGRQYNAEHREERNEKSRQYRCTDHGRMMHRVQESRRNARKRAVSGTYTGAQIQEQLKRQHYRCYYAACGFSKFPRLKENGKWKYVFEVEHTFPLSRVAGTDIPANDINYLVLACESCNQRKNNKFPWEWFEGGRLL